jgi:hypothetical protein
VVAVDNYSSHLPGHLTVFKGDGLKLTVSEVFFKKVSVSISELAFSNKKPAIPSAALRHSS